MSNLNRGDEDPGANTAMFQRFVDDTPEPASQRRRVLLIGAGVALLVLVVVAGLFLADLG